jgi:hypothetical protein
MVSDYTCPQEKVNEPTRSHFLDQNDFEFDRTIWPYSRADLHKLLEKWSKKISVDLASHIPPKMACMIGTFWNVFSQNEEYLWNTQKFLNELLFKVWLKNIIPIVNLNAGYVYQLTVEERYPGPLSS